MRVEYQEDECKNDMIQPQQQKKMKDIKITESNLNQLAISWLLLFMIFRLPELAF